jgi:hypothetical protein
MTRKAGVCHEIILREEEIYDVTLASFYIFDKERAGAFRAGGRLIKVTGCCEFACLAGQAAESNAYSPPVYSALCRVRLGRRTSPFGKSDKTLPRRRAARSTARA